MKTLAEAGHEVHVISPFPLKRPIKNYYDISIISEQEEPKSKFWFVAAPILIKSSE